MRRIAFAVASVLALGILPACATEDEEDVESSDAALSAEWAEYDEDVTPITGVVAARRPTPVPPPPRE